MSHQIFGNLLKYSVRQRAYLFPCRKEVNSTKKQSNDAGNCPPPFVSSPLPLLEPESNLLGQQLPLAEQPIWVRFLPFFSSEFWGSWLRATRHCLSASAPALPLMAFAHRVRWYQLLWEAFFILQLLHLTPLSATLRIPCDVLWLALSPLRCICGRLIPFLCTWVWSLPRFHSLGFLELQIKPKQWNNPALSPSSPLMVCDNCQP